jgi:hypothetical protein
VLSGDAAKRGRAELWLRVCAVLSGDAAKRGLFGLQKIK